MIDSDLDNDTAAELRQAVATRIGTMPNIPIDIDGVWRAGRRRHRRHMAGAASGVACSVALIVGAVTAVDAGHHSARVVTTAPAATPSSSSALTSSYDKLSAALQVLLPSYASAEANTGAAALDYTLGSGDSAGSLHFTQDLVINSTAAPFGSNAGTIYQQGIWPTGSHFTIYAPSVDSQTVDAVVDGANYPRIIVTLNRGFVQATGQPALAFNADDLTSLLQQLDSKLSSS